MLKTGDKEMTEALKMIEEGMVGANWSFKTGNADFGGDVGLYVRIRLASMKNMRAQGHKQTDRDRAALLLSGVSQQEPRFFLIRC